MIHIDGSMMEGGGQLLRMSTTYSAILKEPIRITNIRAKRKQPGLRPQHFTTMKAAAKLSKAKTKGVKLGSREIEFSPIQIKGGSYKFDIGTAGSISLLLQCIVPIAIFADQRTNLTIKGGTAVKWSPTIPFLEKVVYKAFNTMGIKIKTQIERHGFYPKGGGITNIVIEPTEKIKAIKISKPPKNPRIKGISLCGRLPYHVAKRQAKTAQATITDAGINANIESYSLQGKKTPLSPGSFICLWVKDGKHFIGSDSLGARGKPAEKVGLEAAQSMLSQIKTGMTVDRNTSDHLILPASLAKGRTEFTTSEITLHTLTAIELAKTFTGSEFILSGKLGGPGHIICSGQ